MGHITSYIKEKNIVSIVLRWIGQCSLEIYVVHEAVYMVLEKVLTESCPMPYYFTSAILLSLILAALLKRVCHVCVRKLCPV